MKIRSLIRALVLGLVLVGSVACSSSVEPNNNVNGNGTDGDATGGDATIDDGVKPIEDGSINVVPPGSGHDADAEQEPTDPLLNL